MRYEEKCQNCKIGTAVEITANHRVNWGDVAVPLGDIDYMKCYSCKDAYYNPRQARVARLAYERKIGRAS